MSLPGDPKLKLSVCIVTYRHERFIRQCIESVLAQDVPFDFEIVVGEDKSPDGTLTILEDLAARHPGKLRVMARTQNLGAEKNFNRAISECRGEYIAFLEGDNFWIAPDKLRRQAEFLDAHPDVAFCFHRALYVDASGLPTGLIVPTEDPPGIAGLEYLLQDYNPVPLGSMLIRRALLEGIEDWVDGLKIGDWPICFMLAERGSIGFIPETMSVQRVHRGGTWHLLPDSVQLTNIMIALEHVAGRLAPDHRARLGPLIQRFEARLSQQADHDAAAVSQDAVAPDGAREAGVEAGVEAGAKTGDREWDDRLTAMVEEFSRSVQSSGRYQKDFAAGQRELAQLRQHPGKALTDLWKYRALTYLARQERLFSRRRIDRFARSAAKRNPNRSLVGIAEAVTVSPPRSRSSFWHQTGDVAQDPARGNVIVVCHEASRTGAPILGLNIAEALAKRYNVTTITLRDGALLDAFRRTSTDVYIAKAFQHQGEGLRSAIIELCSSHAYAFAVVNSLESRGALEGLNAAQVPIVTLIHEFSSYTNPKSAILDVFKWSTETVFSTGVTLENALFENGLPPNPDLHVLPQGKCAIPSDDATRKPSVIERTRLQIALRPESDTERRFVVIGAGTVEIRKGVDLFIEVATRVLSSPGGDRVRFAWIGGGYNPDKDLGYSVYLRDQLHRAGIADRVRMLGATAEIETAYELSDAFLLSSRLDPLPNVAIDSLCLGRPVFTFDRTGGVAEVLNGHGLGASCVADYLDTSGMAAKILSLAASPAAYEDVVARCRTVAAEVFDFDVYIDRLLAITAMAEEKIRSAGGPPGAGAAQSSPSHGSLRSASAGAPQ
jgi:glycosyltransferase involved in cell wall biosynthesis